MLYREHDSVPEELFQRESSGIPGISSRSTDKAGPQEQRQVFLSAEQGHSFRPPLAVIVKPLKVKHVHFVKF